MEHLLEVRRRSFGFSATTQNWPRTRHYVVRVGTIESRLIVTRGARVSGWTVFATLMTGLVLR